MIVNECVIMREILQSSKAKIRVQAKKKAEWAK